MRVWIGVSVTMLALAAVAETQELDSLVSPGALSHVHSELAGLTNCVACHTPGRGVQAEKCLDCHKDVADSYRMSVSRDFGLILWTAYYSSVFNALRFDPVTGLPLLVRIPDRRTLSNDLFFALSPSVGVSFEYEYSAQGGPNENAVFFRFIYRL